jgi:predicted nucleotidyltransferase
VLVQGRARHSSTDSLHGAPLEKEAPWGVYWNRPGDEGEAIPKWRLRIESRDLGQIVALLSRKKEYLRRKYSIREIGVFGSCVRREQGKVSDLDVLVDFEKPISLLRFVELEAELSEVTGVEVDLVSRKALKPPIGESVRPEVVY